MTAGPSKAPSFGPGVEIDVGRLIETRLLIQANSGGGKSHAIRRLLEQTHGACQHLVIDVEGEFGTLREAYDYVLIAARGGDCAADVRSASLLARRLRELGTSAIVDVSELGARRQEYVRLFLTSLLAAPREFWRPALVVLEETSLFAPEAGRSESSQAVMELMTLGRKRGLCGVLATQRISMLDKSAAAEANNKLIGRSALDIDMRRAAAEIGLSRREELRDLPPGAFYAFGPALSAQVTRVQIGPVRTSHPQAGRREISTSRPAPPSARVREILARLSDLPAEAVEEERTIGELRARIARLEEIRVVERIALPVGTAEAMRQLAAHLRKLREDTARLADAVDAVSTDVYRMQKKLAAAIPAPDPAPASTPPLAPILTPATEDEGTTDDPIDPKEAAPEEAETTGSASTRTPETSEGVDEVGDPLPADREEASDEAADLPSSSARRTEVAKIPGLSVPEVRVLEAVAWMEDLGRPAPPVEAVAFLAGYRPGTGSFNAARGALRTKDLACYPTPGTIALTPRGKILAPRGVPPESDEKLRAAILGRLSEIERRILRPLIEAYPEELTTDGLASAAGYESGGGSFNAARGRLRTLGLVEYPRPGSARASDLLFPGRGRADANDPGKRSTLS